MDIRFEKREHLQEKPDQKNLGFGKHFTDYMFVMDWDKEQDGMTQQSYRTAESRVDSRQPWYFTMHRKLSRV